MAHTIARSIGWSALLGTVLTTAAFAQPSASQGLQAADIYRLRSVGDVQISPDGRTIVYAVTNNDRPGRPYSQVWQMDAATGATRRLGGDKDTASEPHFSPDGKRLAYFGEIAAGSGLIVAQADGSSPEFIAPVEGTNHPLPSSGDRLTWSPDGRYLAFVAARPGPEADANGDPMVITRYLYKPTASEGGTRANDNRRLHIFVVDVATKAVRQLTDGDAYYHDYLAVEFGGFPHEAFEPRNAAIWPRSTQPKTIMDALWERSPLRYSSRVKTPTLFLHGENDNDVPIAEAEQFFIALKDVGVETVLVRYPREGHGIREVKHVEDTITRSIAWYRRHFAAAAGSRERQ